MIMTLHSCSFWIFFKSFKNQFELSLLCSRSRTCFKSRFKKILFWDNLFYSCQQPYMQPKKFKVPFQSKMVQEWQTWKVLMANHLLVWNGKEDPKTMTFYFTKDFTFFVDPVTVIGEGQGRFAQIWPNKLFWFCFWNSGWRLNCPSSKGNHAPTQKFERPNA